MNGEELHKVSQGVQPAHRHQRGAASIVSTLIFCMSMMTVKARFASSPPAAMAALSTRGVVCQGTPVRLWAACDRGVCRA
jgi:hypothetical protein